MRIMSVLARTLPLGRQRKTHKAREAKLGPSQKDRGEILRALFVAYNGKMLAKDSCQNMHLSEELFSMLIASMDDYIEIESSHLDRRKSIYYIKMKISSIGPLTNLGLSR
jgi:hypothetical protein